MIVMAVDRGDTCDMQGYGSRGRAERVSHRETPYRRMSYFSCCDTIQ